ncbi:MAG: ribonuclease Z [Desulfobacterales bacterium]|nr:ribonuclease Z [Desulfobacterales bacterium]
MRPSFHPRLINEPFDDPGLFIPFLYEKRALIFDLGDISCLSTRDVLKISHVFISHTHMDHFIGFDRLLRLFLGRDKNLYLYGPEGFLNNIEGKLSGYTWNLVNNYQNPFTLNVTEIRQDYMLIKQYRCRNRFISALQAVKKPFKGILLQEPALFVRAEILDHSIPCLGFSIKERFHVNIMKDRVASLGLEIGPWLKKFKQALFTQKDLNSEFVVPVEKNSSKKKTYILGDLAEQIALITPGQKITYIADVVYSKANLEKITHLAKDSDHLFIEASFLEKHQCIAQKKFHLTAWQAGCIAAKARGKQFTIFHFSPRYMDQAHLLQAEAQKAYESNINSDALP